MTAEHFRLDDSDVEWLAGHIKLAIKIGNAERAYRLTRVLVHYTR